MDGNAERVEIADCHHQEVVKPANVHSWEEEFLKPMSVSQTAMARAIGVSPRRINAIVVAKRAVSADTALHLARAYGASEQFWMGLRAD